MKKNLISKACTLTAALATLLANTTSYASVPFVTYQPKAPKSLIKK